MLPVPSRFFTTSGSAVSEVSDLNSFDQALIDAGIGEQNLVPVSSVLPQGIEEVEPMDLERGAVTHCILAEERGTEGELISAGVAYGYREDGEGGYVAEGHGHMSRDSLEEILVWKLEEIGRHRDVAIVDMECVIEELTIPLDHYGTAVAALVLLR
jgi:arginine decarboxylase